VDLYRKPFLEKKTGSDSECVLDVEEKKKKTIQIGLKKG